MTEGRNSDGEVKALLSNQHTVKTVKFGARPNSAPRYRSQKTKTTPSDQSDVNKVRKLIARLYLILSASPLRLFARYLTSRFYRHLSTCPTTRQQGAQSSQESHTNPQTKKALLPEKADLRALLVQGETPQGLSS